MKSFQFNYNQANKTIYVTLTFNENDFASMNPSMSFEEAEDFVNLIPMLPQKLQESNERLIFIKKITRDGDDFKLTYTENSEESEEQQIRMPKKFEANNTVIKDEEGSYSQSGFVFGLCTGLLVGGVLWFILMPASLLGFPLSLVVIPAAAAVGSLAGLAIGFVADTINDALKKTSVIKNNIGTNSTVSNKTAGIYMKLDALPTKSATNETSTVIDSVESSHIETNNKDTSNMMLAPTYNFLTK